MINSLDNSQSPFDQDDKEVAESMSCTANYPLQFEACMLFILNFFLLYIQKILLVPNDEDDNEEGDTVFMPIKSNDDDEPVRFHRENKVIYDLFI